MSKVTIQIPDGEQSWNVNGVHCYSEDAALNYISSLVKTCTDVSVKVNTSTATVTLQPVGALAGGRHEYAEVYMNGQNFCEKNKIQGIKYIREATSLGLKEAKDAIETYGMIYLGNMTQALAQTFNSALVKSGFTHPLWGRSLNSLGYNDPVLGHNDEGKAFQFQSVAEEDVVYGSGYDYDKDRY